MRDHAEWVEQGAEEMADANAVGDTRKLHKVVKRLSGKEDKKPAVDLSVDKQGSLIADAKERVAVWFEFLQSKFAATERRQQRGQQCLTYPRGTRTTRCQNRRYGKL